MQSSNYWIEQLAMSPHPEGGHYKESYRSKERITDSDLGFDYDGLRPLATSIYFLLSSGEVSHFHRLKQDELWYYHAGSALTVAVIHPEGKLELLQVGPNLDKGEQLQVLIPGGCVFGSFVNQGNTYSLVGCMVTPGFDFADFELFTTGELLPKYPEHAEIIQQLTKESY